MLADAKAAIANFDKIGKAAEGMGRKFSALKSGLALGAVAVATKAVFDAFAGAKEAAQATRVLDNQIKNLGTSGKAAFSGAADFAQTLGNNIGVDDDAIKPVLSKLASFPDAFKKGSDGADAMKRATAAAFDLQAIGIGDAGSNIVQIGKALTDPVKGMAALNKSGVSFSAETKKQIANLVKQGKLGQAQKLLLAGIETNAKGAAAAATTPVEKLKVAAQNLAEGLAGKVLPMVNQMATYFTDKVLPAVTKLADWLGPKISTALTVFKAVLSGVVTLFGNPAVQAFATAIGTMVAAFLVYQQVMKVVTAVQLAYNIVMAANPVVLIAIAVAGLIAGIVYLATRTQVFQTIWKAAWGAIQTAFSAVFNFVRDHWKLLVVILTGPIGAAVLIIARHWSSIKNGASGVYTWITGKFNAIVGFVTGLPGRIGHAAAGMWDGMKTAFKDAINFIIRGWNSLDFSMPSVDTHIPGVGKIGGWTLGLPDIPQLHSGGVIRTGGLAMLHAAEVVTPASAVGNTYNTNNFYISPLSDPLATARTIEKVMDARERTTGRRRLLPGV